MNFGYFGEFFSGIPLPPPPADPEICITEQMKGNDKFSVITGTIDKKRLVIKKNRRLAERRFMLDLPVALFEI